MKRIDGLRIEWDRVRVQHAAMSTLRQLFLSRCLNLVEETINVVFPLCPVSSDRPTPMWDLLFPLANAPAVSSGRHKPRRAAQASKRR